QGHPPRRAVGGGGDGGGRRRGGIVLRPERPRPPPGRVGDRRPGAQGDRSRWAALRPTGPPRRRGRPYPADERAARGVTARALRGAGRRPGRAGGDGPRVGGAHFHGPGPSRRGGGEAGRQPSGGDRRGDPRRPARDAPLAVALPQRQLVRRDRRAAGGGTGGPRRPADPLRRGAADHPLARSVPVTARRNPPAPRTPRGPSAASGPRAAVRGRARTPTTSAHTSGPRIVANRPTVAYRPYISPRCSGGLMSVITTRSEVHVAPRAAPPSGPITHARADTPSVPATTPIARAKTHTTRVARRTRKAPNRLTAQPATKLPGMAAAMAAANRAVVWAGSRPSSWMA